MRSIYKLYKRTNCDENVWKFYIIKNGVEVDTCKLENSEIVMIGILNNLLDVKKIISEEQKFNSFGELEKTLNFLEHIPDKRLKAKGLKFVKTLDKDNLLTEVKELSKKTNLPQKDMLSKLCRAEKQPPHSKDFSMEKYI